MTTVFVLIAGTLAAGAALLLVWPLLRRRGDQPAAAVASIVVLLVVLLGGAGLYASFTRYQWSNPVAVADTPAAMTARLAMTATATSDSTGVNIADLSLGRR